MVHCFSLSIKRKTTNACLKPLEILAVLDLGSLHFNTDICKLLCVFHSVQFSYNLIKIILISQVQNYGLAGHYDPHFDFSRV